MYSCTHHVGIVRLYFTTAARRRSLPAIPLTTTTTTTTSRQQPPPPQQQQQQQQRENALQTFDDDGHYSDIHWSVGGAARIPSWRRSFFDDPGHYDYPDFNQQTGDNSTGEQRQRSSSGYQGLNQVERQPPVPHDYTGIGSGQQRSRINAEGYMEPVEHILQPPRPHDRSALRSKSDSVVYTSDQRREELPQRPRSYGGVEDTSSPTGRHSYLEIIGYLGTNNGNTAKGYEGLDPVEVEEMRRRVNRPHEYAGLTDGNSGEGQGEVVESEDYQGLDPVEVEEARQRARQPRVYAGLRDNVEDL